MSVNHLKFTLCFPISCDGTVSPGHRRFGKRDIDILFYKNILVIFGLCVSIHNLVGLLSQTDIIVSKCHLYVNLQDD